MGLDLYSSTIQAFTKIWNDFLVYLPNIVVSIIILAIGWLIASAIGTLIAEILRKLKFNQLFEKEVWREALSKAEVKIDVSGFIGIIFKWVLVIVFLLIVADILGLTQFGDFLTKISSYLPNVIAAIFIFVVAVIIADILEKIVRAAVESARIGYSKLAGAITKWSIWVLAIFAILAQLKVAENLINTLFTGIVAVLVITFGLAFGLGGKDIAAEILEDIKDKFKK